MGSIDGYVFTTFVLQFCSSKCVLSIFIYNIALQNTDFSVLKKSSMHFLISILLLSGEEGYPCPTPSLSHPRSAHHTRASSLFYLRPHPSTSLKCFTDLFVFYLYLDYRNYSDYVYLH